MIRARMISLTVVLLIAPVGLWTDKARAQLPISTVQSLLTACESGPGSDSYTYCLAYVAGIADWMTVVGQAPIPKPWPSVLGECAPDDTTYGAAIHAFINWAHKHPEAWSQRAAAGIATALTELWPCKP